MDVQSLCLAVLSWGPATGYEIRKAFEEGPFAHFHAASFGSIYPALRHLEAAGQVAGTDEAQDKRPDKRVYRITPAGETALRMALLEPPRPDRVRSDSLVVLFMAHLVPPGHVGAVTDAYLEHHRARLARMTEKGCADCATPGQRFVHGFGVALYEAAVRYLENHSRPLVDELDGAKAA